MFRIFGPPGTGKTTTLLNMVDDALEKGTHPHSIAFLAFTRKAANEARDRAAERFNLNPKTDLIHFRTLHSLALTMTDIRSEQVMQESNFRELSRSIGVKLGGNKASNFDDDIPSMVASNDPVLGLINLARLRKVSLREQYNISNIEQDWNTVNYVEKCLRKYKDTMNLYDFTDMLEEFAKGAEYYCPKFDLCFLDEAQDLSPLQWEMLTRLMLSRHACIVRVMMTKPSIDGRVRMLISLLICPAVQKPCHNLIESLSPYTALPKTLCVVLHVDTQSGTSLKKKQARSRASAPSLR